MARTEIKITVTGLSAINVDTATIFAAKCCSRLENNVSLMPEQASASYKKKKGMMIFKIGYTTL